MKHSAPLWLNGLSRTRGRGCGGQQGRAYLTVRARSMSPEPMIGQHDHRAFYHRRRWERSERSETTSARTVSNTRTDVIGDAVNREWCIRGVRNNSVGRARPRQTSRGFLPWRFAYAGPVCPPHHLHGAGIRKPSQKWRSRVAVKESAAHVWVILDSRRREGLERVRASDPPPVVGYAAQSITASIKV
jgi:hypothetical protein